MSEQVPHSVPHSVVRHCDVAIVGGSAAGLAAALQLGRQRRSVIVVDAGEPRNAPAAHMHGYLGHEGSPPVELVSIGREEVRRYGVEVVPGRVIDVSVPSDGGFRVDLVGGHSIVARRLLVATGIVDELPDIDGLPRHWGRSVVHCPFCHGYEIRDRRIVQVATHPMHLHPTALLRQLTPHLTVVAAEGLADVLDDEINQLRRGGVDVVVGDVRRLVDDDDSLLAVELSDGSLIDADAVLVGPRFRARVDAFASIGLSAEPHPSGLGEIVQVDELGATAVPGVYAAGNVTDPGQQVLHAAAHGSRVGAMISFDLAHADLRSEARHSGNETDWDHRYGGDRMWSGNPNGALVAEVASMEPGRALDVGAGEGGDAIWLAERGWRVTATDISRRALDHVAAEAERRDLEIDLLRADANGLDPFERAAFDLVTAHYASIPRDADGRGVTNLLGAVAPGGTLLVVSHDLAPMRAPIDTTIASRPFDPDAFVRVEDVAGAVEGRAEWHIELYERRPRPPGAASAHHVDDIVIRARRLAV